MLLKNAIDTIGNRAHSLQACSAVPRLTAPPRAPEVSLNSEIYLPSLLHIYVQDVHHFGAFVTGIWKYRANETAKLKLIYVAPERT
jgi:hypothetical protein